LTVADLKRMVREANLELVERGLVFGTFGNASGIERDLGLVVIKPSGVPYGDLSPDDMAVVSLESGEHLEGLKPSSDTPTHLEIYRSFATAAVSSTPIRHGRRAGRKLVDRSRAWEPRTPTTSEAPSPALAT